MNRVRALKILLLFVGLALVAGSYPLVTSLSQRSSDISPGDQMILGIYLPIGIFLLLAIRNLPANRSLIICFAWSTLAHMTVMSVQAFKGGTMREDMPANVVIGVICVALLALAPHRTAVT